MEKGRYSIKMLIGSILAGVLYAVIGELFYQKLKGIIPDLFLVTIYLIGLFLWIGFAVWLISKLVYHRVYKKALIKQWVWITLTMVVFTAGFEWLYERSFRGRTKQYDAYLFIIDSSGSMDRSDPNGLRFEAIETVLAEKPKKFSYAVYLFSDSAVLVRELGDQTEHSDYDHGNNHGMTAIKGTLQTVLEDIESGVLDLNGRNGHIILLSDGAATDIQDQQEFIAVLDRFVQKGISISTVGLLDADEELMSDIATITGGIFVPVEEIGDLEDAMVQAGKNEMEERNLLDDRKGEYADLLYAGMRIGFLILLGGLIGLQKAVVCERFLNTSSVIKSSIIGSILAGEPALIRMLFCGLVSFTLLREDFLGKDTLGAEVYRGKGYYRKYK